MSNLVEIPVVQAQSAKALRRYGAYPIVGSGLKRLQKDLKRDGATFKENRARCKGKEAKFKFGFCDGDRDRLANRRELVLGTDHFSTDTDGDRLTDRDEILIHHTNPLLPDTDDDGISDGDEVLDGNSNPLIPNDPSNGNNDGNGNCTAPNFDSDGNTIEFQIPLGEVGNSVRGATVYSQRCNACHPSAIGEKGVDYPFPDLKTRLAQSPMFITNLNNSALADLVAYLNRGQVESPVPCATPTPGATPTPNIQPSATPTTVPATPTPYSSECSNEFFDTSGNTSQFGNAPLSGNISAGATYFSLACSTCHGERGTGWTNSAIRAAVTGPLMQINSVTNQQYADLTAYLNRASAPQNCNNPPPTPTPLDDISAGSLVYQATCSGCHSNAREFRRLTQNKLLEAIAEKDEMNNISLSSEQMRVLLAYLHSL